jgi:phosphoserine phosphatase
MNDKNLSFNSQILASLYLTCIDTASDSKKNDEEGVDTNKTTSIILDKLAANNADLIKFQKTIIDGQYSIHLLLVCASEQSSITADVNLLKESIVTSLEAQCINVQCQFLSSHFEYNSENDSNRFVITLMAPRITVDIFSSIIALLIEHNVLLCSISSLSDDSIVMEHQDNKPGPQAYALEVLIDDVEQLDLLNDQLAELASKQLIDVSIQVATIIREQKRLACFDMDSTLIQAEVIDELAKEAGVGEQVAKITETAMRGELDFNQSFIKRMSLLEGLDESVLEKVAERLVLSDGVEVLFAALNRLGYKTAILSGGFDYFGRFLQKKLGVDYVYANELNIIDGKVTGKVVGDIVNGDKKAYFLQMIATKENINLEQVIAVGDGANDLPMLALAGLGVAYKAKPLVKAAASYSIDYVGLDGLLYMLGFSARQIDYLTK